MDATYHEGVDFCYLGGDIVGEIVNANKLKCSDSKVDFVKFDITAEKYPKADLWLCRAVFYHLSNRDTYLALEQFASSGIRFILTTSHITDDGHLNTDIKSGDWRLLNLRLPPFNFPHESLWEVNDYVAPHPPATLTLWSKSQVEAILPALRELYKQ